MAMEYSSNDISAYFQHCPECDIQWRSHHLRSCEQCDATGIVLVLEEQQIEVLMEAVNTQFYGVDDETDILFVLSEMMIHLWPDVPDALLAQACWMHLSTLEETDEIEIAKEYSGDVPSPHPSPVKPTCIYPMTMERTCIPPYDHGADLYPTLSQWRGLVST
jgi:hypothetical protein